MNSLTSGAKLKVAGLFKAAYRWLCDDAEQVPTQEAPSAPVAPPPPPPEPPRPAPATSSATTGDTLQLPLQPVLDTLPPPLKAKLRQPVPARLTFPVSIATILAQLPQGSVRITFGELRLAATGVFTLTTDCDQVMVALPLSEILPRINLAQLARRNDQKTVDVPDDITSPFSARGRGLTIVGATEAPSPARPVARGFSPDTARLPLSAVTPTRAIPMSRSEMPARPAAPAASAAGTVPPTSPRTSPPITEPAFSLPLPGALSKPSQPVPPPRPAGGNGANVVQQPSVARALAPQPVAQSAAPASAPAEVAAAADCLQVTLASLTQDWPHAVRLEIAQMNLADATVALPGSAIEQGLRRGKVCFPWKTVRNWVRPVVPPQISANDGAVLELPLSVIAPLFIARRSSPAARRRKVTVDETIPNLFFGFPQPDSGPGISNAAPVAAPAPARVPDTNFYVWSDDADTPQVNAGEAKRTTPIGTDFTRRYATPNEIVARASGLEGVEGALVALPDGLAVASRVPAQHNADTLAAFLPQLFAKLSQCTRELRMGELNNLNFTVGNVPWKIFRVHGIFFAAFGRVGEPLPTAQLAALAAELDRKPKAA